MSADENTPVLSLHPTFWGVAWVVALSPVVIVDWGVIRPRGSKNEACLRRVRSLLDSFNPSIVLMRHAAGSSRRRVKRNQQLAKDIERLAKEREIPTKVVGHKDVVRHFERFGARTREGIARVIAENVDALSSRLPPKRMPWMNEDARLGIFDSAAIAIAYFIERDLIVEPFPKRTAA